ncbi:MAG: PIN domain-containing protein [Candidatus Roizmanbacteria bacterium]
MVYFIDTNIFIRAIVKDDKKASSECEKLLTYIKEGSIRATTSTLVLAEIIWTLQSFYSFSKKGATRVVKGIMNLSGLSIVDSYNPLMAIELYEAKSIKYIDAVIATSEDVRAKRATVVSYDGDFDKVGVLRKEPSEII